MATTSKLTDEAFVNGCIQLVRKGSFITLYKNLPTPELRDPQPLRRLRKLIARSDWLGVTSRAVLAEINDQVGLYKESGILASSQIGMQELAALATECQKDDPNRNVVRAHAWFLLQCAVAQFRLQSGQTAGVDLLSPALELFDTNRGKKALTSQHIQSLFYFWRGRIYTTQYNFRKAEADFQKALDVADDALEEKLAAVERMTETQHNAQVTAGNYVLSTVLGFGLGQLRQLEGKLGESLQFLRIAVPLSRGSVDFHRRGFALLLRGTARRSENRSIQELDAADDDLSKAKRLFGGPENIPPHHLHLARVNHQLALSKLTRVPSRSSASHSAQEIEYLKAAASLNQSAAEESDHESCTNHRDPVLDYGIAVVHSLIKTALGDYSSATRYADEAIVGNRQLPEWLHGWAWVAMGMALAGGVRTRQQEQEINSAETAFARAFLNDHVRTVDRAAALLHMALLYSRIKETEKASIYCDRAMPLVEASEYGWIKDLAERVRTEVGTGLAHKCIFDLRQLVNDANAKGLPPWPFIEKSIDAKVRRQLLVLKDNALTSQDVDEIARELGVSRATVYAWRREFKDPEAEDVGQNV